MTDWDFGSLSGTKKLPISDWFTTETHFQSGDRDGNKHIIANVGIEVRIIRTKTLNNAILFRFSLQTNIWWWNCHWSFSMPWWRLPEFSVCASWHWWSPTMTNCQGIATQNVTINCWLYRSEWQLLTSTCQKCVMANLNLCGKWKEEKNGRRKKHRSPLKIYAWCRAQS